jgi:P-type Ca2+ transporter type 2C
MLAVQRAPPEEIAGSAHALAVEAAAAELGTDRERGLSEAEARTRLALSGRNELAPAPPVPAWRKFLAQFADVLVVLLLAATAISGVLWALERDTPLPYEAMAILAVVLLNALLGFVQEARAEAAVAALRRLAADEAEVIRGAERRHVPAAELVPGDLVVLEEGDRIPADARLVDSAALQTSEAALTGESLPVSKDTEASPLAAELGDRHGMVFGGTIVTYGHGRALVTATGMGTEMGRIATLLEETREERTPLQQELDRTGKVLGLVVLLIAAAMVATIVVVEDVRNFALFVDVLILGVALAVAAVPEGLPAIVTAVLALGVQRLARRNAIVRRLAAVETLGSASVIASDKTGTLTKNEMTVRAVVTASGRVAFGGSGYAPEGEVRRAGAGEGAVDGELRVELERALAVADRANNAELRERDGLWTAQGDPTEAALRVAARKAGLAAEELDARLPRVGEVPFSSERKLMSTLHRDEARERLLVFTKGAPDVLLSRCTHELVGAEARPLGSARCAEILRANESLADEAMRTLGVAFRSLPPGAGAAHAHMETELVFAGLIGMLDPPRPEARAAVARARAAGIRPLMITGDHPRTASVIARELGIATDGRAVTGAELERQSEAELLRTVAEISVYARVNPEHKLRIVGALQRQGEIVAMTGDGVNDAPALKAADIGVAMGLTGTDVAKQAADIVLADDDFATIVAAVEEGRAIFANIRKFLRFLLSSNTGEVLTMFLGVVLADELGLPSREGVIVLPLLATQILWINLVTDGAPALALGLDPAEERQMRRPPRGRAQGAITPRMWRGVVLVGLVMAAGTLWVLDAALPGGLVEGRFVAGGELPRAQTMAFTTLMLFQLFNVLNARSDVQSALVRPFTNRWLWLALGTSLALQVLVLHVPFLQRAFGTVALGGGDWLLCAAVASSVLWLREAGKLLARLGLRSRESGRAVPAGPGRD